jgi:predicted nucleotidyltransferase component of viral defense system
MEVSEDILDHLRKLTILALFSDNELMDILVLKGGNALELAYKLNSRASMDIDVSMEKDFEDFGLTIEDVKERISKSLSSTFWEEGYKVFDLKLEERPKTKRSVGDLNWGGYAVVFKVIPREDYERIGDNIEQLRRESLPVAGNSKTIKIDISKFEFVAPSEEYEFYDFVIKVYTPRMIAFEKIRAICQQMLEYAQAMRTSRSPRPRDFYDIYMIIENLDPTLDFSDPNNQEIIKNFFSVKKVPLYLLSKIKEQEVKDYHEQEFSSVEAIVKTDQPLKPFSFYYDYVVHKVEDLNPIWDQESISIG